MASSPSSSVHFVQGRLKQPIGQLFGPDVSAPANDCGKVAAAANAAAEIRKSRRVRGAFMGQVFEEIRGMATLRWERRPVPLGPQLRAFSGAGSKQSRSGYSAASWTRSATGTL